MPWRGVGSRSISSYEYVGLVCLLDLVDLVDLRRLVVAAACEAECIGGRDALSGIASRAVGIVVADGGDDVRWLEWEFEGRCVESRA